MGRASEVRQLAADRSLNPIRKPGDSEVRGGHHGTLDRTQPATR